MCGSGVCIRRHGSARGNRSTSHGGDAARGGFPRTGTAGGPCADRRGRKRRGRTLRAQRDWMGLARTLRDSGLGLCVDRREATVDDRRLDARRVGGSSIPEWRRRIPLGRRALCRLADRHPGLEKALANATRSESDAASNTPTHHRSRCCDRGANPGVVREWRFGARRHRGIIAEGAAGRRDRDAADSRRGKIRARDDADPLAGVERPAAAVALRACGPDEGDLSEYSAEACAGDRWGKTRPASACAGRWHF